MKGVGFANGCANNRKHKGEDGLTVPTVAVAAGAVAHTELAVEPPHHHVLAFELGLGAHCFFNKAERRDECAKWRREWGERRRDRVEEGREFKCKRRLTSLLCT